MASRQSVSSILKPPKVRAPLKEIEPVDQDADENTATSSKRKVSFSGMNKIKMYNTCATSLTVNQAPMFDEKISISSDSLNGDRTKLSGKFEKSDGQITFESTDCTNVEENGRVIIEYESPSDNMEMTEAKVGKLHDTMFLIDNYDSECINSSLDNSETNMEFTEAIQVGRIITVDMESDFSSTELSETLNSEDEKQLSNKPTLSSDDLPKIISNKSLNSSSMEFTCTNTKLNSVDIDLSNMEFTCMAVKSQKSASNDDYKSFSMELTQVTDRVMSEDCSEFIYESSVEGETSYESKNNSNCELEIEPKILYAEIPKINNDDMVCLFRNVNNGENNVINTSLNMVSMDIDPPLEYNEYEKNDMVVDNSSFVQDMSLEKNINKSLVAEQSLKQSFNAHTSMFDPNMYLLKEKSLVIEENQPRKYSRKTMIHTDPLIVEIYPEKFAEDFDMSLGTVESQQNKSSTVLACNFNPNQSRENEVSDKSALDEDFQPQICSGKSIALTNMDNDKKPFYENEDLSDKSATKEENHQKNYSRKSMASKSVFNQSLSYEIKDLSDKSTVDEEIQQQICSRKSIAPTDIANEIKSFYENEDSSDNSAIEEENYQKNYSRKSIASKSVFNQSQSYEIKDLSDKSTVDEEIQQQICSRKSIAPTNIANEIKSFYENEDSSDNSAIEEENYSRKSIASKSVFNQSQSYEIKDLSDKSTVDEEIQQQICSRKSIAPTNIANEIKSFYENEDSSDNSAIEEENYQKNYSRKSIASKSVFNQSQSYEIKDLSDKSTVDEEIQQQICSRKSFAPTNIANEIKAFYENEDSSDNSAIEEENYQKNYSRKSIASKSVFNQSQSYEIKDLSDKSTVDEEIQQQICSRKSIAPTYIANEIKAFYENEDSSDNSAIEEENYQKNYSRKSIASKSVFNQSQSYEIKDLSDKSTIDEENQQKLCSKKSIASTSTFNKSTLDTSEKLVESTKKRCSIESIALIPVHDQSCSLEDQNVCNTSEKIEENIQKRYSRKSIGPTSFYSEALGNNVPNNLSLNVESNVSYISSNSDAKQLDISDHYKENLSKKIENQGALINVISDDDLNSPFRKKSRKSIILSNLTNQPVDYTLTSLNNKENLLKITDDQLENVEYESEMDISIEYESKAGNMANISSQETNTTKSILYKAEGCHQNNENHDSIYAENEGKTRVSNELGKNETGLNDLPENHEIINESDDKTNDESTNIIDNNKSNHILNLKDLSYSHDIDTVTNTICVEGISNMSITDEKYHIKTSEDKSTVGNRKRSYNNRECILLSSSSFVSNSNVENSTNKDFNKEEFLKVSPIKTDDAKENTINDSAMVNTTEEDVIEKESYKENLNNEVSEFLTKWTNQFVDKKLSLDKCTNKEWIFNILDSNIILTISYSPNDFTFLKVENISFTTNIISQDEIMKFGVNWILSKYNPKIYKQICYTPRDVELLLKCLLEDIYFISKMMKNMSLVRDIYFVTFKDNKAEFVLHKMFPPLMVRIEVLLSNIHKLSVKDITVDSFFGSFNTNLLDESLESVNKDFKVLQSFIEKLRNLVL